MTDFKMTRLESSPLRTTFLTTSLLVTMWTASQFLVRMTDSSYCDCICSTAVATLAPSSRVANSAYMTWLVFPAHLAAA